jgi:biotin carboxyl carrier protein
MKKQFILDNETIEIDLIEQTPSFVLFKFEGEDYSINLNNILEGKYNLSSAGKNVAVVGVDKYFAVNGVEFTIEAPMRSRTKGRNQDHGQMISPMPGKILKIFVAPGEIVTVGSPILVMEAMKMEHTIKASKDGKIEAILYKEGDQVAGGVELVKLC